MLEALAWVLGRPLEVFDFFVGQNRVLIGGREEGTSCIAPGLTNRFFWRKRWHSNITGLARRDKINEIGKSIESCEKNVL